MAAAGDQRPAGDSTALYVDSSESEINNNSNNIILVPRETALQALNTIVQVHFEKTLEKKRAVDLQKKELWKLFQVLFVFLAILFGGVVQSTRLECKHWWMPVSLCAMGHLIFYVAMAQTLRCINGFKYQRRCHKLTLGLATENLKRLKLINADSVPESEYEVHYQEPSEGYFNKFKRKWALCFLFLVITFGFMASATVTLLCAG